MNWDTHSLADHWEQTHEVEFEVRAPRRVTLDPDVYARLEEQARTRGVSDHFLKGAPTPEWMEKGIPYLQREKEEEKYRVTDEECLAYAADRERRAAKDPSPAPEPETKRPVHAA